MPAIQSRKELLDALSQAAELEHFLCCSYLYAGFSIKKTPDENLKPEETETTRGWVTSICLIARQEMEHLGMVCNLLSSLGAGPNFLRANFPQRKNYLPIGLPFELRRFDLTSLNNFIDFEKPDSNYASSQASQEDPLIKYDSLQDLYNKIKNGFVYLNKTLGAENLFVGPTSAQITNETLFDQTEKAYQINLRGVVAKEPSQRLAQALSIIEQILVEGEGSIGERQGSHFARFLKIKEQYKALKKANENFEPAHNVVTNPVTYNHRFNAKGGTPITNSLTLEVANLFNLVYEAMLLMLIRLYSDTNETHDESIALEKIAFFPLMTMGIRPLGEVLMTMPCGAEADLKAGPTFEITRPLQFLPHRKAAWKVLEEILAQTGEQAELVAARALRENSPTAERLDFIAKSLVRNAKNFADYILGKEDI